MWSIKHRKKKAVPRLSESESLFDFPYAKNGLKTGVHL